MKTTYQYIVAALISGVAFFSSCSDVELPGAANEGLPTVSGLTSSLDRRELTLTWNAVPGATSYVIYRNNEVEATVDASQTSYVVLCPYGQNLTFTVKYTTADGLMSLGQSVDVFIEAPEVPSTGTMMVGYVLTANSYSQLPDDDEVAAAEWFEQNYVFQGTGAFITTDQIASLDPKVFTTLWIHIDRVGIGKGYENLPFDSQILGDIHNYAVNGGNLYLTKHATQLVNGIARIDDMYAPGIFGDGEGGVGNDIWCVNPVIGSGQPVSYNHRTHALFAGIEGDDPNNYGFYNFPLEGPGLREDHNCMWDLNAYGFSGDPNVVANWEAATNSTVLATWGHVQDYCCAGIVEFKKGSGFGGKIIANGLSAYEFKQNIDGGNIYQGNTERLTANALDYLRGISKFKAAYLLTADSYENLPDDDEVAAARWFKETYIDNDKGAFVTTADLATLDVAIYKALWIHIDRIGLGIGYENLPIDAAGLAGIRRYLANGGNLYLSKHATQVISGIARIEDRLAPGIFSSGEGGEGGDVWCVNNVIGSGMEVKYDHRDHEIFAGIKLTDPNGYGFPNFPLEGPGVREDHNCMWDLNAFGFPGAPNVVVNWQDATASTVLATWGHVQDYCCAGIVEFNPTDEFLGKAVCNGLSAYEFNQAGGNVYQDNVELLTKNTIDYLME